MSRRRGTPDRGTTIGQSRLRPAACAIVGSLSLHGCIGIDAAELAEFRPLSPNTFEFRATTTQFYGPASDGWSEGQRFAWLAGYLRLNAMCPYGFRITSRTVSFEYQSFFAYPVDEIEYRGSCRS